MRLKPEEFEVPGTNDASASVDVYSNGWSMSDCSSNMLLHDKWLPQLLQQNWVKQTEQLYDEDREP